MVASLALPHSTVLEINITTQKQKELNYGNNEANDRSRRFPRSAGRRAGN
jgi:hypothetical protein